MKKFLSLLLLPALCLLLFSCTSVPSMSELLTYQKNGAVFDVKVTDGTEFSARVTLGEKDTIMLCDSGASGICFVFDGERATLEYGDTIMELPDTAVLKAKTWISLFRQPDNVLWHIKAETLGGIDVFTCVNADVTLYIDAATRLPLKMVKGDCTMDVLSCG